MPESMNWSLAAPYFAAAFAIGYLLGSIPFGLLLTRFAGLGDIRTARLGQYRRDERPAHRATRASPPRRLSAMR